MLTVAIKDRDSRECKAEDVFIVRIEGVTEQEIQSFISDIEEKYYYGEEYDGWVNGVHWYEFLKEQLVKKYGADFITDYSRYCEVYI